MTKEDIHIPPEAVEAAARADYAKWIELCVGEDSSMTIDDFRPWHELDEWERQEQRDRTTAAIHAALENWPGMHIHEWQRPWLGGMSGTDIILPLPQENPDAEA